MCRLAKAASLRKLDRPSLAEPASESLMPAGRPVLLLKSPIHSSPHLCNLQELLLSVLPIPRMELKRVRIYEEIGCVCFLAVRLAHRLYKTPRIPSCITVTTCTCSFFLRLRWLCYFIVKYSARLINTIYGNSFRLCSYPYWVDIIASPATWARAPEEQYFIAWELHTHRNSV